MKTASLLLFLLCLHLTSFGQSTYDVNLIPKELLPRAASVVRSMEMNIEVKELDNVIYTFKKTVTILNKNGDEDAGIYIWYNKSRQIKSIKGMVYDEFGKPIGKIAEKEFKDVSAASDYSLFEDSRMKTFQPSITTYPYTLEYEYEIRSKQTLNFPDWYPNAGTGIAVEYAVLHFTCGPKFNIRYKELHYPGKVAVETHADQRKTYTWEVKNRKALRDEPYSPNEDNFLTSVKIAPEQFDYLGIRGNFSNWNEMGKWVYDNLLKDRKKIPEATSSYIQTLTRDIKDPKEKAKKIYEFVQQKTRYISVQVGVGGYQPILASDVDRTGYGDCKALVNYTQGLLQVAGIPSWYVIVASGNRKLSAIPDFASMNQFDHVILCIPFENDTTWVDCTSKENPFGYVGTFTDDRLAIACTADGGKLIHTPKFEDQKSVQTRKANFNIDDQGNLSGDMITEFEGFQYDNREGLIHEPYAEQLKKLPSIYSIDNMEITSFQLRQDKTSEPITTETIKLQARNYGSINNGLLYLPLNEVNRSSAPQEISNRLNPVYINRGYVDTDEIVYTLPKNYTIDFKPQDFSTVSPFGKFSMQLVVAGNVATYTRKIELKEGTYPAEKYPELVNFYQAVRDADERKIILKKLD